jgi:hypothetical protein
MTINTQENNPDQPLSIVDEAKRLRDEMKAENDRREKLLADEQKMQAERLLTGTAGSNIPQKMVTEEDMKKSEALNFWKGTAIEDAIKQYHG